MLIEILRTYTSLLGQTVIVCSNAYLLPMHISLRHILLDLPSYFSHKKETNLFGLVSYIMGFSIIILGYTKLSLGNFMQGGVERLMLDQLKDVKLEEMTEFNVGRG